MFFFLDSSSRTWAVTDIYETRRHNPALLRRALSIQQHAAQNKARRRHACELVMRAEFDARSPRAHVQPGVRTRHE